MNAKTWDWVAVGLAVALASSWLLFRIRNQLRKQKDPKGKTGACGATCEGCPFAKGCGGKSG